jgi:hypothetical protein
MTQTQNSLTGNANCVLTDALAAGGDEARRVFEPMMPMPTSQYRGSTAGQAPVAHR